MYQNIYVKRSKTSSEIHLWDDKTGYSKFQYKPYAYLKSQTGQHRSLYGDKLKKLGFLFHLMQKYRQNIYCLMNIQKKI